MANHDAINSGPTAERVARSAVLALFVVGYAGWSLWDGYLAYPRANVQSVLRNIVGADPGPDRPVPSTKITAETADRLAGDADLRADALLADFGPSALRNDDRVYLFGNGGFVTVELRGDRVEEAQWQSGPEHSPTDLAIQKLIGFALLPVGIVCIGHFVRVVTTRAVLTDAGLKLSRHPLIAFDAMTGLSADREGRAGCYELSYMRDGRSRTLRLDDYALKEAPAIVKEIARRKGFTLAE